MNRCIMLIVKTIVKYQFDTFGLIYDTLDQNAKKNNCNVQILHFTNIKEEFYNGGI